MSKRTTASGARLFTVKPKTFKKGCILKKDTALFAAVGGGS